jgi:hypothetical protein
MSLLPITVFAAEEPLSNLSTNQALFGGIIAGSMVTVYMILSLVFLVALIIADWKIFTKAGEAGWKCIIPFYNTYTEYKFSWSGMMGLIEIVLLLVSVILMVVSGNSNITQMSQLTSSPMMIIATVLELVAFVIAIIQQVKLSKVFGHGIGFALGLIFLGPIFRLILGFGSSQYVGLQE